MVHNISYDVFQKNGRKQSNIPQRPIMPNINHPYKELRPNMASTNSQVIQHSERSSNTRASVNSPTQAKPNISCLTKTSRS